MARLRSGFGVTDMQAPWLVGLTGGIGSGKSAAARHFSAQGIHVVDADDAARWVVEPGEPGLHGLVDRFGGRILQPDGQLDRAALRQKIFSDTKQRLWVEQLLHPLIRKALADNLAAATSEYAILVSPLLIERGQYQQMQRVLVVDVPEALQVQRVLQRDGVTEQQVQAIVQAQLSREERLRHADDVIVNDGSLQLLEQQVMQLHQQYLRQIRGEV